MTEKKRGSFSGSIGFVLAAAGSAVGLGNIWRFPYLAAKDNGGLFIFCYLILVVTFGFTLLITEIAIGRKTKQSPLTAYGKINKKFGFLGSLATLVPIIILPYYCAIGGWVFKYFIDFISGKGTLAAQDGYFSNFISGKSEPIIWLLVFIAATAGVVLGGVDKGIEKMGKILMPILVILIIGISIFSLTLKYTDEATGITRTGLQGLKLYLIPNFEGVTFKQFFLVIMDAMGQLFYSISVAMGIMVAYGSYVPDKTNINKSINQIEIFDTVVAILAGLMIVPAVYVFAGTEGMSAGPGLMFISLPKVFNQMGKVGIVIGIVFFLMVIFAAVSSSVSIMEAIVASIMDKFKLSRKKSAVLVTVYAVVLGIIVCLGYNVFYFELKLPNGSAAQLLDLMDYISNSFLMPFISLLTSILIGWVVKPHWIISEVEKNGEHFRRARLYYIMIRYIVPPVMLILFLVSTGFVNWLF